jgi:regulatory protein
MKITAIEIQKKHPSRRSIFIEGEFFRGVTQEVVAKLKLKKGQEVNQKKLGRIIYEEEFTGAKNYAFKLLSYRARSRREIMDKFKEKSYDPAITQKVVENLEELNFINDKNFAYSWARSRLANKPVGKQCLSGELWQKGVDREIIAEVIESTYKERDELTLARELAERRLKVCLNLNEATRKRRLSGYLARRGFSYEVINEVLEALEF